MAATAARSIRLAGVALVFCGVVFHSDALNFLDIAASVTDRVVPRPSPQSVPEFILIAEMANKNRHTSPRPPGSVPEFVLIAESLQGGGGGGVSRPEVHHTTGLFQVPSVDIPHTTPLPPTMITTPDPMDFTVITAPSNEVVIQPSPEEEITEDGFSPSTEEGQTEKEEDFDEDKIYFEEWEKKDVGDPR